jgi:hypothetical protein
MAKTAEQMELFEPVTRGFQEGGLKDEGGKTDPVSGNEVPPGSLREEVRDDIPAQLSEGEFVFPADVVRYIGLEKLMMMRQEAKQGLAQMEAMGQMGNSEEATMPDDLPFDMYDLEVEDDGLEMQTGGMVPAPMSTAMGATTTGGSYNPATNQFQPFSGMGSTQPQPLGTAFTPPTAASAAYSPPTTPEVQYQQPTLYGTTGFGPEGVEFEDVTYVNEQGQILNFKRNKQTGQLFDLSGNPTVVPEGYTEQAKEEEVVEATPTTGVGTQTTRVRDDGDDKGDRSPTGAKTAFGGELVDGRVVGGYLGDLSFDNMSLSDAQSFAIRGVPSFLGQLAGRPNTNTIPDDAIANVTNLSKTRPDGVYSGPAPVEVAATVRMSGKSYNSLLTGSKVTQRRRMESAIDFIKEKYKDQAMDPDKIIDLEIELADMDMREDVRETLAGKDFSKELKEEISANNEIGNVSVDKKGNLSIKNPFEAERVAIQRQRDEGKDVAPSRGRDTTGRPGSQASQVGIGRGPGGEDRDVNRGGDDRGSRSSGSGYGGMSFGEAGRAKGGLIDQQMKRSGLASKK